jgi:hypothetical protein
MIGNTEVHSYYAKPITKASGEPGSISYSPKRNHTIRQLYEMFNDGCTIKILTHNNLWKKVIDFKSMGVQPITKVGVEAPRNVIAARALDAAADQQFLCKPQSSRFQDWVKVEDMSQGDALYYFDPSSGLSYDRKILFIARDSAKEEVFGMKVENDHSFLANGYISYNYA